MWQANLAFSTSWKHQIDLAKVSKIIADFGHALANRHKPRLASYAGRYWLLLNQAYNDPSISRNVLLPILIILIRSVPQRSLLWPDAALSAFPHFSLLAEIPVYRLC